jgi:hypothetical protein
MSCFDILSLKIIGNLHVSNTGEKKNGWNLCQKIAKTCILSLQNMHSWCAENGGNC